MARLDWTIIWYYGVIIGVTTLVLSCLIRDFFFLRILWVNLFPDELDLKRVRFEKKKKQRVS